MTDLYFTKLNGMFLPSSESDAEIISALPNGEMYRVKIEKPRNSKFHRKYFALLDILFDLFNPPPVEFAGSVFREPQIVLKNRERFRKDIAIACGHYDLVVNIKGEVRAEAKSISFSKMDEVEFAQLYSRTIDYGLKKIAVDKTRDQLEAWVQSILDFA